jgi:hypothetical protein
MRLRWPAAVLGVVLAGGGCGKSDNQASDKSPSLEWRTEQDAAAREREQMAAARREMEAANNIETQRESADAFTRYDAEHRDLSPVLQAEALNAAVAAVRARMAVPAGMQVRNVHFNPSGSGVCMEINYVEDGKYVGFRRAFVGQGAMWIDHPDDVAHRVFELNMRRIGCFADTAAR